jgi:hypothetical protein
MKKKSSVTQLIDDVYKKERRYITNTDKDNFFNFNSPIFELQRFHNIKPYGVLDSVEHLEKTVNTRRS